MTKLKAKNEVPSLECVVCFSDIALKNSIICSGPNNTQKLGCQVGFCDNCFVEYLNFCQKNKNAPVCINPECKEWYYYSQITNKPYLDLYLDVMLQYYNIEKGKDVVLDINNAKIISVLRAERNKKLEAYFTPAINLVVKLAFSSRLKRINNKINKKNKLDISQTKRLCPLLMCDGYLLANGDDLICTICEEIVCSKCGNVKILKNNNKNDSSVKNGTNQLVEHKCSEEDIESLSFINSLPDCPNCKIKVFKNWGCDSITCSVCGTNFKYSTGKVGGHGSSNTKTVIDVSDIKHFNFLDKIKDGLLVNLILKLQREVTKNTAENSIYNIIKKYKLNKISETNAKIQISKTHEANRITRYRKNINIKVFVQIEKLLQNDILDESNMRKFILSIGY